MASYRLSKRGQRLAASPPFPEYLQEHYARLDSICNPATRPNGYIPLSVAENLLLGDDLIHRMSAVSGVSARVLGYDKTRGALAFRERLSRFLGRHVFKRRFEADQLAVLAGAGSVLEILFHCLCDPGDGVLVPTPSYAGFWADLETRDELAIVEVPTLSHEDFRLTAKHLDRALEGADRPVKALLFTTPNNPMGAVYSPAEVEEVLNWARRRNIHVVFDEIYALSVFGETTFTSCAQIAPTLGESVHLVWAFSKDFGASGLRCGVLVSENQELMAAVDGLSYWACCSGHTQALLGDVISDDTWVDAYLVRNRKLLRQAYQRITAALEAEGIPYFPAEAGFFLMLDLRRYLVEPTWDAELALWRRVLNEGNLTLTPGRACRNAEPGLLRLCYAAVATDVALTGIQRLSKILST